MKFLLLSLAVPILASYIIYRAIDFDAADFPVDRPLKIVGAAEHHSSIMSVMEKVGDGLLLGPEDLAYDAAESMLYTGCADGWIRRVKLEDAEARPVVEDWTYVGGRPLGLAFGPGGHLVVANADKGLMVVEKSGAVRLLTEQAEGLRFGLTDGVDVARDGTIYFTDASYKHGFDEYTTDFLEGRPHGRLLSYNPLSNETRVLVRDVYFANGVALSPDEDFLVYCETFMRRCNKYHIRHDGEGAVETFVENTPGFPDNIRHDGHGHFWIGLPSEMNKMWDVIMRYPQLRKIMYAIGKRIEKVARMRNGGVLEVDLEGNPLSLYTDPKLFSVSGGLKIGRHLYLGNLKKSYVGRVDLGKLVPFSQV